MDRAHNVHTITYKEDIVSFLTEKLDVTVIYLFGSINSNRFNDESDIDIAIITEINTSPLMLYELAAGLSAVLKRDIHLVDFNIIPETLKIEILRNKNIIYCNNESKRLYHEMNALTAYQKLNEEREIVIKSKYGEAAWRLL